MTRMTMVTRRRGGATTTERLRRSLTSNAGSRLRRGAAGVLLVAVPLLTRLPILRRHPLLRWLEIVGGLALIAKLAAAMRDWDPKTPIRLDVE